MVASLTPWRLATSATLSLSASRRIRTICSSLYRFFFMCFSRSKKPLSPNYGGSKKPGQVTGTSAAGIRVAGSTNAHRNGRRCAQVTGRRHGGNVAGVQNEGAGAGGARATGANKGGYWYRRCQDALHNGPHGGV